MVKAALPAVWKIECRGARGKMGGRGGGYCRVDMLAPLDWWLGSGGLAFPFDISLWGKFRRSERREIQKESLEFWFEQLGRGWGGARAVGR